MENHVPNFSDYERVLEKKSNGPIDIEKLKIYSLGIAICCNGEYGQVYFNESENHVYVCLGDSNPFDEQSLIEYLKEAIHTGDYKTMEQIKVTVENEASPYKQEEWKVFDPRTKNFK